MDGSTGGRSNRRNDSISSVMSITTDSPVWTRQNTDDCNTATATPRDPQRGSRANTSLSYHAPETMEHDCQVPQESSPVQHPTSSSSNDTSTYPCSDTTQTDEMATLYSVYQLLEQLPSPEDVDLVDPYQRAALLPPITQESLAELEVIRIVSNPKLRHDVNFDKELHFRPNLDGSRGKHKLKAADEYWKALVAELELYRSIGALLMQCQDAQQHKQYSDMMKASQIRMPGMFETIKEILKTLVPGRDQIVVEERLDVSMIMQQISNGVFDLMDLALWLATLLKAHCAPMRDDWVDQMVAQTRRGIEEGCQRRIVLSLRQTLGILEAMKLDVANHQIRHLRGMLIEDTVNFQQRYHLTRLHQGRLDVKRSRMWFKREESHLLGCDPSVSPLEVFASAFLRSLLSQSPLSAFPETFHLDAERLRCLRNDLHQQIQLDICCDLFDLLVRNKASHQIREKVRAGVRASIIDILGETPRFIENAGNIAAEIVRSALVLEGAAIHYNSELADFVEKQLQADFQTSSVAFSTRIQDLMDDTLPRLLAAIKTNSKVTILTLHETMLAPAVQAVPSSIQPASEKSAMDEILRRATHLGVIHWHIWSPMVYNIRDEECRSFSPLNQNSEEECSSTALDGHNNSSVMSDFVSAVSPQTSAFMGQASEPSGPSLLRERPPQ